MSTVLAALNISRYHSAGNRKFFAGGLEKRIVNSGKTVYNNRKAAEDLRCPARFGRAGAWLRIFRRHRIVYMPHPIRRSSP